MDNGDQDPNNPFVWLTSYSRIPVKSFCRKHDFFIHKKVHFSYWPFKSFAQQQEIIVLQVKKVLKEMLEILGFQVG